MKESLTAGVSTSSRITIDAARTIDFMGEDCRVYATPELVRDIEMTCRDLLLQHLDPGEDSVGSRVELDHTAPTLLGMWSEISATISAVKGRAVTFEVTARDNLEQTASGLHNRFIVDVNKTADRLRAKAGKASSA